MYKRTSMIEAMHCSQVKVVMKEVANTQYVACMNPTAGSFHITPRMQRHFVTLAVHMPSPDTIRSAKPQLPNLKLRDAAAWHIKCTGGFRTIGPLGKGVPLYCNGVPKCPLEW